MGSVPHAGVPLRTRTIHANSAGAARRAAAVEPGAIGHGPATPDPARPGWYRITVHILADQAEARPAWAAQVEAPAASAASAALVPVARPPRITERSVTRNYRPARAERVAARAGQVYRRARRVKRSTVARAAAGTAAVAAAGGAAWVVYQVVSALVEAVAWCVHHPARIAGWALVVALALAALHALAHKAHVCPTCGRS